MPCNNVPAFKGIPTLDSTCYLNTLQQSFINIYASEQLSAQVQGFVMGSKYISTKPA